MAYPNTAHADDALYECAGCGHLHYEGMGWYAPCPICNCKGQVSCYNCGQLAHRHRETDYSTMCPTGGTAWAVLCRNCDVAVDPAVHNCGRSDRER
jgi:hypothetical protein